jgi:hypothetical protein
MGVSITVVIVLILIGYGFLVFKKNQKVAELKNAYQEALRGTDKQRAVALGRAYYGALRSTSKISINGVPTVYDETAIANDLATMKV